MAAVGSAMVERMGSGGNAAVACRQQRGGSVSSAVAVVAGRRQCSGSNDTGITPAATGLVAVVAVLQHCGISFKKSATFMASDQEPSGGHAWHVLSFSHVRHLSLACWQGDSIVLQQVFIVK
jgi:hypothetical protein